MERGEQGGKGRHYQAPPLPPVVAVADLSGLGVHGSEPTPIRRCRRSIRRWLCMHERVHFFSTLFFLDLLLSFSHLAGEGKTGIWG